MEEAHIKIESRYQFDEYLMFLIQETTKRPSAEILNFFHELAGQVCEIGLKNKKGHGIRKNITDYFPGSSIPFHMLVTGYDRQAGTWNQATRRQENIHEVFQCNIEVGFPESRSYMKTDVLDDIAVQLMEKALLGGGEVEMPAFVRPNISTPRMYQGLMDAFMGKTPQEKKKKRKKKED